jgi:hypothetical protein
MNRPTQTAYAIGNRAMWRCVCANPPTLHGTSGGSGGPTRDSVVVCEKCGRVYFVIPVDRSQGPPIEVVELFGMPEPVAAAAPN